MIRSIREIEERILKGKAVVLTAQEVAQAVAEGSPLSIDDVDVVTTATRAVMSGTYAVLSFKVSEPDSFLRARSATINGVPAMVGPCPNERLGVLDLVVFGTAHRDAKYGGGNLFRDLVARKDVMVEFETKEGRTLSREIMLDDIPFARLFGTRHCFKNYSAFVNPGSDPVYTIFHAAGFNPSCNGATFSGCGILSPLKNDPLMETIGIGTRILMNGADGFVIGTGTRSTQARPNLSGFADMRMMIPEYMGGFITSAGPECVTSWAIPVPVVSQPVLDAVTVPDRMIPLPVNDVNTRQQIGQADYGQVWDDVDLAVRLNPLACTSCESCAAVELCPEEAISFKGGRPSIDRKLCFNCGLCTTVCGAGVFSARLGSVRVLDRDVPVVLRQSDRARAERLAVHLKHRILEGTFRITEPVEKIAP